MDKQKTSYALSTEAHRLLKILAENFGINQSAVLELAIREKAERDRVSARGQHEGKASKQRDEVTG